MQSSNSTQMLLNGMGKAQVAEGNKKSFLALLDTQNANGDSVGCIIRDILNEKLNGKLFGKNKNPFQVGQSTSRDAECGPSLDLRSYIEMSDQWETKQLRFALAQLQQLSIIEFEEKIDEENKQLVFIITDIDSDKFFQVVDKEQFHFRQFDPEKYKLVNQTIRYGSHQLNVKYVRVFVQGLNGATYMVENIEKSSDEKTEPSVETDKSLSLTNDDIKKILEKIFDTENKEDKVINVIDLIAEHPMDVVNYLLHRLNQFCDLSKETDEKKRFVLYFNSSDPDYPIDFRLVCNPKEQGAKNIKSRLSGMAVCNGALPQDENKLIFEVKPINSDEEVLILKGINYARMEARVAQQFNSLFKLKKSAEVEAAIVLFKRILPNHPVVKSFHMNDGAGSVTRNFPHIRSEYLSRSQIVAFEEILQSIDGEIIITDWREPVEAENKKIQYQKIDIITGEQWQAGQLIINVLDVSKLETNLLELQKKVIAETKANLSKFSKVSEIKAAVRTLQEFKQVPDETTVISSLKLGYPRVNQI